MMKTIVAFGMCWGSLASMAALDSFVTWQGQDGGFLDTADNWSATPGLTTRLRFVNTPSSDYTVKLANDWAVGAILHQKGYGLASADALRVTFDLRDAKGTPHTLYQREGDYWRAGGNTLTLEHGTIACVTEGGVTNGITLDNANNPCMKLIVNGTDSTFVGNLTVKAAREHQFIVTDGAHQYGRLSLSAKDSRLVVSNGAEFVAPKVKDGATVWIGGHSLTQTGSYNNQLIVDDAYLDASGASQSTFYLGCGANGSSYSNTLTVCNGGHIELPYYCCLGGVAQAWGGTSHSDNNTILVTGKDSTLTNTACSADFPLMIGSAGTNNVFRMTDYASGYATELRVGGQMKVSNGNITSMYNRAIFDGGSTFDCTYLSVAGRHSDQRQQDALCAGHETAYNSLTISDGAKVTVSNACTIGASSFVHDNLLRVTGTNSLLKCGTLTLGITGAHSNRLEVVDGAKVEYNGDLRLGYGLSETECGRFRDGETRMRGCGNVIYVENAAITNLNTSKTVWIGSYTNGNDNTIFLGNGVDWRENTLKMSGFNNTLALSNATVRFTNGFYPIFDTNDPEENGTNVISFAGTNPRLIVTGGNGGNFCYGCRLRFELPGRSNGYEQAPLETQNAALNFADDTRLEFGSFGEFVKAGGGKTDLIRDTVGLVRGLGVSDELLASWTTQARAAVAADPDAARYASRVAVVLSADKKKVSLSFPRTEGMILFVR